MAWCPHSGLPPTLRTTGLTYGALEFCFLGQCWLSLRLWLCSLVWQMDREPDSENWSFLVVAFVKNLIWPGLNVPHWRVSPSLTKVCFSIAVICGCTHSQYNVMIKAVSGWVGMRMRRSFEETEQTLDEPLTCCWGGETATGRGFIYPFIKTYLNWWATQEKC